jgi:hypothetical protein
MRGLIIASPWVEAVAAGRKAWELRGGRVRFRERIALIRAGGNCVVGTAVVSDCLGPMTARQLARARDRHGVEPRRLAAFARAYDDQVYAWVLTDARELARPVTFRFPRGAVKWVKLPPRVVREIEQQMRRAA